MPTAARDMDDDSQIIRRVLSGETEAYRLLIERYERPVFAAIRGLLARADAVEDVAQDVFCSAFAHLGSYDGSRSRFSTWLFTIARNRCLNERARKRPSPTATPPDRATDAPPDVALSRREALEALDAAVASLPEEQRTALVLSEFADLPQEEVARIEGVAVGTVKSRLSRARGTLRETLAAYVGDEP